MEVTAEAILIFFVVATGSHKWGLQLNLILTSAIYLDRPKDNFF